MSLPNAGLPSVVRAFVNPVKEPGGFGNAADAGRRLSYYLWCSLRSENRIDAQAEFRIDRHEIGAVEIRDRFHKRKVKPVPSAPTLGTGAADRVAEQFGFGDLPTGILFGMIIASLAIGYFLPGLDAVLGFWRVSIFTRRSARSR